MTNNETERDEHDEDGLRGEIRRLEAEVAHLREAAAAQAELGEALRQSEQRHAQLIEQCPIAVIEWDHGFHVVSWNAAAEGTFGYSRADALGKHARIIVPEAMWPRVDQIWVSLLAQKGGSRSRNDNVTADGRTITCEWYNGPRVDADGEVVGVISLAEDVTGRVNAAEERRQLEVQMERTAKLESLEVLAGGVAHDFNNLLVGILGSAGLALLDLSPESPARSHVELIENTAQRAADLTRQMLAYSGKGRFVVAPVSLSRLVAEMTHLLEASIKKSVLLRFQLEPHLPAVEADVTQLRQVMMNLLLNASDAIGERSGVITVTTGVLRADRSYLSDTWIDEELPEGDYAFLEISDTGIGMDAATRARVFDPFFTTKAGGHGLGLAAVIGIVRGHQGFVKVYSEAGKGTSVKVGFPCTEKVQVIADDLIGDKFGWTPAGTVLVVDDEETVRTVSRRVLESAGFDVITARDGQEGFEMFEEHRDQITVVLLDMTMPKLSGEQVFRRIRGVAPGMPVVLMSGYNEQDATSRFVGKGLAGFIQKPFRPRDMLDVFRRVLGSEPG